jgi:MYXO-CTERM domain-containing protein
VRVTDDDGGPGLVTSVPSLTVNEGGNGTFTVRLSSAPTGAVTVNVAASGDTDVTAAPPTLSFNTTDWSTPKTVTVSAAHDTDITNDMANVAVSATGFATRSVAITVTDDDPAAPVITSTPVTTAVVAAPYSYDVNATGMPAPTYALTSTITGMTINATSGVISWTPTTTGSFSVGVRATNGVSPDATQNFTVIVAADMAPTAVLTKPIEGEVVSGKIAEFFGDGVDDVSTTKADFSIDGTVVYTDSTPGGHYHINGAHNLWDTTLLTDGPHKVRITVYDTKGQIGFKEVNVTVANGGDAGGDAESETSVDAGDDGSVVADADLDTATVDDTAIPATDSSVDDGAVPEIPAAGTDDASGCGCRTNARGNNAPLLLLAVVALVLRRRIRT